MRIQWLIIAGLVSALMWIGIYNGSRETFRSVQALGTMPVVRWFKSGRSCRRLNLVGAGRKSVATCSTQMLMSTPSQSPSKRNGRKPRDCGGDSKSERTATARAIQTASAFEAQPDAGTERPCAAADRERRMIAGGVSIAHTVRIAFIW